MADFEQTYETAGDHEIPMPVGTYTVSVSAPGYEEFVAEGVQVKANEITTVQYVGNEITGTIKIMSVPAGATVSITKSVQE